MIYKKRTCGHTTYINSEEIGFSTVTVHCESGKKEFVMILVWTIYAR